MPGYIQDPYTQDTNYSAGVGDQPMGGAAQGAATAGQFDPSHPYGVTPPGLPPAPGQREAGGPGGDTPYAGMEGLFNVLTQQLGMDSERARSILDRYQAEYAKGKSIEAPLLAEDQAITGKGGQDPNDPRTYGRYAGGAISAAHDRDLIIKQLEASGLQGGELEAAKAQALAGLYQRTAGLRQDAIQHARDRLYGVAKDKELGFSPGQDSGAGQAMLGYYGNRYNTDTSAATQRYGIDVNADTQNTAGLRSWLMQKYGIDIGAGQANASNELAKTTEAHNYELGKQTLQQNKKPGFLGGLLRTLGTGAATYFGGPGAGALFGAATGGGGGSNTLPYTGGYGTPDNTGITGAGY